MRPLILFFAVLLIGCAAGTDRHGRPIDPWKPVTRDTSPDPGRKPTLEEAKKLIQSVLTERQQNVTIRSMHEAAAVGSKVISGWMVCYTSKGTNVFGSEFSFNGGNLIVTDKDGQLKATAIRDGSGVCK